MNKQIEGYLSWYETGDSTGSLSTVAMQSIKVCPDCKGTGRLKYLKDVTYTDSSSLSLYEKCPRCHGDGKLINQVKYDRDFPGIALPESVVERLGNPIYMTKIRIYVIKEYEGIIYPMQFTHAFYWDKQKNDNCRCGHEKKHHITDLKNPMPYETPSYCLLCKNCKQYEQRICDVTPTVFDKLAPLSQGLLRVRIEVV